MSETKTVEFNELIAERVPPGDRWRLVMDERNIVYPSLTEALDAYWSLTKFTGDYRFSPRGGQLFVVKQKEEEIKPRPQKKFNIYGDPE